jgi:hypothetical protein
MEKYLGKRTALVTIVVMVLLLLGGVFYWYELRPMLAQKACVEQATDATQRYSPTSVTGEFRFNQVYQRCMLERGIAR